MALGTLAVNVVLNNEAFEREMRKTRQTIGSFRKDVSDSTQTISKLGSLMRGGAMVYSVNRFTDMAAAMLEAKRKGESMFNAFLSGLPIINRLSESANRLANELSGLAAAQEAAAKSTNLVKGIDKTRESLERSIAINSAGKENAGAVQAKFAYEDRLKEIDALEAEAEAVRKYNAEIDKQIATLQTRRTGVPGGGSAAFSGGLSPTEAQRQRQIADLQSQKLVIQNLGPLRTAAEREYEAALRKSNEQLDNQNSKIDKLVTKLEESRDLERIVQGIGMAFTNAFDSAIAEGQKLRAVMQALARDISRVIVHETVSRPIGQAIAAGIGSLFANGGGGGGMIPAGTSVAGGGNPYFLHEGGIVGETALMRNVSGLAMLGAPRLHTGLRPNEFTAVLERGETVIPKGGGRGMTINVQTPDVTATQRWLWNNRHSLADMMMGAGRENNKIRRTER